MNKKTLVGLVSLLIVGFVGAAFIQRDNNAKPKEIIIEKVNEFKVANVPVNEINRTPVVFENVDSGLKLAGIIYTPKNMDKNAKLPAIIVQGPMGATKEQTQSLYAMILATHGYLTFVYDYSYIGASEGAPRGYEDPDVKAADIRSAISFVENLPNVDANRIAAVGICGSGVYLPLAAINEPRLKVIASVNPFAIIDSVPFDENAVVADKKKYDETGIATYIPDMIQPGSEGAEYYFTFGRGAVTNRVSFVTWSQPTWANFHPTEITKNLTLPYLFVVGEKAFTRDGAEKMYNNLASTDKKLVIIPGARHFDMYDGADFAVPSINAILEFFNKRI